MPSKLEYLTNKGLAFPPKWLPNSICYETIMGSMSYGVSNAWPYGGIEDTLASRASAERRTGASPVRAIKEIEFWN